MVTRLDPWQNIIAIGGDFDQPPPDARPWLVMASAQSNGDPEQIFNFGRPTYLRIRQVGSTTTSGGGSSGPLKTRSYLQVDMIDGELISPRLTVRRNLEVPDIIPAPYAEAYSPCELGDALGDGIVWIAAFFSKSYSAEADPVAAQLAGVVTGSITVRVFKSADPLTVGALGWTTAGVDDYINSAEFMGYDYPYPGDPPELIDTTISFSHTSDDPNNSIGANRRFYVQIPINVTTGAVGPWEFVGRIDA